MYVNHQRISNATCALALLSMCTPVWRNLVMKFSLLQWLCHLCLLSARCRLNGPILLLSCVFSHRSPWLGGEATGWAFLKVIQKRTEACQVVLFFLGKETHTINTSSNRRDYPLNLSISISGGKETNKDSLSNGEWSGNSPNVKQPFFWIALYRFEALSGLLSVISSSPLEWGIVEGDNPVWC